MLLLARVVFLALQLLGRVARVFLGVIGVVAVIVFTGLTAWDAQRLKELAVVLPEEQLGAHAVVGALSLYLNFINIFFWILRFIGNRRD